MSTEPTQPADEPKIICEHCPRIVADEWRVRGAVLRLELRRRNLTFREKLIAELILDKSYGWNMESVVFPSLKYFRVLTGISESDVIKVLKTLHGGRIIFIRHVKGRPTYSINPDMDRWQAMPRLDKSDMQAHINLMREHNGLEPIHAEQEAALNFKVGASAKKIAAQLGEKPMSEPKSEQMDIFPNLD